jgi:hypothetical protein
VFGADTARFLERGCALIVGTVSADGEPCATRGWGLTVLPDEHGANTTVKVLLDADDARALVCVEGGGAIAITGADVPTLRSIQVKGRVVALEAVTPSDERRAERYCEEFFADVHATDGVPVEMLERLAPAAYVGCVVRVEECYDQTPGPGAGASIAVT